MSGDFVIATTGNKVGWYVYDFNGNICEGEYQVIDFLDLNRVPLLHNKTIAKKVAIKLGLKTWRYVKINA